MKLAFLLLLSSGFSVCEAQITTNVFWSKQTSLPPRHTIYYDSERKLTWDDFKAEPVEQGNTAAVTMSGFGYHASMKSSNGKGQLNISVYCYFNKEKSWVKPTHKNGYVLNHEQRHFDISYIAAHIFIQRVKNAGLDAGNCNNRLPKIYDAVCDLMNRMQDQYDDETKNGQHKEQQGKWDKNLSQKISAIKD